MILAQQQHRGGEQLEPGEAVRSISNGCGIGVVIARRRMHADHARRRRDPCPLAITAPIAAGCRMPARRAGGRTTRRQRVEDSSLRSASMLRSCSCTAWRSLAMRSEYFCGLACSSGSAAGAPFA